MPSPSRQPGTWVPLFKHVVDPFLLLLLLIPRLSGLNFFYKPCWFVCCIYEHGSFQWRRTKKKWGTAKPLILLHWVFLLPWFASLWGQENLGIANLRALEGRFPTAQFQDCNISEENLGRKFETKIRRHKNSNKSLETKGAKKKFKLKINWDRNRVRQEANRVLNWCMLATSVIAAACLQTHHYGVVWIHCSVKLVSLKLVLA